jgi:hypothetical protein
VGDLWRPSNSIYGQGTSAIGKPVLGRFYAGCSSTIGLADGVLMICRCGAGRMRNIAARGAGNGRPGSVGLTDKCSTKYTLLEVSGAYGPWYRGFTGCEILTSS